MTDFPSPHLAPFTRVGDLLLLSGQLALGPDDRIHGGTIEAQTDLVLDRISMVLQGEGLTLADVVKTTVWLVRTDDFSAFDRTYAARFGSHRPARSTVRADLVLPGALVEIEAVAARPKP
ncbi:MAG TPA: RidA family protein [Azospirillaceae bacterium]|nr:RidA family protein [Azospirillaceae bacterium]